MRMDDVDVQLQCSAEFRVSQRSSPKYNKNGGKVRHQKWRELDVFC
jgi:hypothetical protein